MKISDYQLGEANYEAYAAQANYIGMPFVYKPWEQLTGEERQCWIVSAFKIAAILTPKVELPPVSEPVVEPVQETIAPKKSRRRS